MGKEKGPGARGPHFTPSTDAARRARAAKLAAALRANLGRRKADLAHRQESESGSAGEGDGEAGGPPRQRRR